MAGDAYYSSVSLLLHCDGTNGATTLTDSSSFPKTVGLYNGATLSTADSKFGGSSIYFSGGGGSELLITDAIGLQLGAYNFTIEFWAKDMGGQTSFHIMEKHNEFSLAYSAGRWTMSTPLYAYNVFVTTGTVPSGWFHYALVRNGTSTVLYINGVSVASATSHDIPSTSPTYSITMGSGEYWPSWNAYVDEIRITKGVARYTSNFTPPTTSFANYDSNHYTLTSNTTYSETVASYTRRNLKATKTSNIQISFSSLSTFLKRPTHLSKAGSLIYGISPLSFTHKNIKYGISGNILQLWFPGSISSNKKINVILESIIYSSSFTGDPYLNQKITEILTLSISSLNATRVTSDYVSEVISIIEILSILLYSSVSESIIINPLFSGLISQIEIAVSSINIVGTASSKGELVNSLVDLISILDSMDLAKAGYIVESIIFTETIDSIYRAINILIDSIITSESVSNQYISIVGLTDLLSISPSSSSLSIIKEGLNELFSISISSSKGSDTYLAYLLTPETMSVSNYNNYNFDGAARFNGKHLFYNNTGLYEYGGNRDDGSVYTATIETIAFGFGSSNIKQVPSIYLGATSSGPWYLKVKTDGRKECYYKLNKTTGNLHTQKIAIGKGLLSRYFQFEMVTDADEFDVESIDFYPIELHRKL